MKTKTIVNFILDKSGSMESVKDSTISGFNEYIGTLKKDKKSDYEFTLTLFNETTEQPIKKTAIQLVHDLDSKSYNPGGNTALYDAVCKTIKEVKEKKGQKVLNIIMTDGMENASKEYTQVQMKALVEEKEKGNWTFVYLGANQDSYAVAQQYGIHTANIANFNATRGGVGASMVAMASNTVAYAASSGGGGGAGTKFFSEEDKDLLNKTK